MGVKRTDRIQLSYDLTFTAPFHCGTGLRVGLIDRTVIRDHEGHLYVPGSTIKGCIRENCERLNRLYEVPDDELYDLIASPHDGRRALWAMGQPATMITRIFGWHYYPGRLNFNDAQQTDEDKRQYGTRLDKNRYKRLQTSLYTQVRLDRPTRTAVPGALYTSEFGARDLTFKGSIAGWLECFAIETLENGPTYSLLLLLAGLHMLDRLGANKSTGKGQCSITITEFKINNAICNDTTWQSWLDHLDTLSAYSEIIRQEEDA